MGTPLEPLVVVEEKPTVAKAVIAGATALAGQLTTALVDGSITANEIISGVSFVIIAVASVWAISNKRS